MGRRGCLRSKDGSTFLLAPKVTTVGREGCDLVAPVVGVDYQHAVIEYSESDDCFVIQDLNTQQGTYINDCRVQNAAVRLAPGDEIRFGNNNNAFRFEIDAQTQSENKQTTVSIPPVQQRGTWTQPLTVLNGGPSPPAFINSGESLPQLQSVTKSTVATWASQVTSATGQQMQPAVTPRPPSATLKSRPMSAGGNIPQTYMGRRSPPERAMLNASTISPLPQGNYTHRAVHGGGWVNLGPLHVRGGETGASAATDKTHTQDQRVSSLTDEVRRLSFYESECKQKDEHIQALREEIAELQAQLRQLEVAKATASSDAELTAKLLALENEVGAKKTEILSLKEQIQQMKGTSSREGSPGLSKQELNNRTAEVNSLKQELERVRKDKNIMSGLVSSMQRDMTSKDTTVTRMTEEIETIKAELNEKNVQLVSMQSKFKKVDEDRKYQEEIEAKDKEIAILNMKMKSSEAKVEESKTLIEEIREELKKKEKASKDEQETQKSVQFELEAAKTKYLDMERTERLVRVDLEQAAKRFERLKKRVIEVTYSTPGIKTPSGEIEDDALFETLQKVINERSDLKQKVKDANDSISTMTSHKKENQEQVKKLRGQLNEVVANLREKGLLCAHLKLETDKLRCLTLDEDLAWTREGMVSILNMIQDWQAQIEASLEECGINVRVSQESPSAHILNLRAKGNELKEDKARLNESLTTLSEKYRQDLEEALKQQREELQNVTTDEVSRVRVQHEETTKQRISEVKLAEEEKFEAALEAEKQKYVEMETQLAELKASIGEREALDNSNKEAARLALEQIESYKKVEEELRESLKTTEAERLELQTKYNDAETRWNEKTAQEVESYKEEIKQHAVTICAMTERVNKLVARNKTYQSENNTLKQSINELRSKPRSVPKPQVIIQKPAQDVVAMEQLIIQLRREIVDYKKQTQDSQNTIMALKKDIAGASARLSDMTGELSEEQKQHLEKSRVLVMQKDAELLESRQQLAKLSQIIDQQGEKMKTLNLEITKQKAQLTKYQNTFNEKDSKLQQLQTQLETEITDKKKQREEIEDEGRITSEMTALGAQCRGERHEQIIARQREALMELRTRVKALEQVRPPVPSQDQALQQVILLKKELAEMRANNAISDVNSKALNSTLEQHVNKSRGIEMSSDAEIERSAHRETLDSLETSENTFLSLLRGMASALEMDDVGGLRSMAHIPRDERKHLATQREHSCEVITSKIRALKERIRRKDELLQGYERDLAKLRQAEKLAEHKHAQVESLSTDVRNKTEETQYLRESLSKTRDKLDQEKRLNSAIKQKKTFHLENEPQHCGPFPRHQICQDDIFGKQAAKKKAHNETLKRKNYEIRVLKNELSQREQDLVNARTRLTTVESSSGFNIEKDPVEIQ